MPAVRHPKRSARHNYGDTYQTGGVSDTAFDDELRATASLKWAPSSRKSHNSSWNHFLRWSSETGSAVVLPIPEATLCAYVVSWKGNKGSASLPQRICGIRAFHLANGHNWHTSAKVKTLMDGVKRAVPRDSFRAKRPPACIARIESITRRADVGDGRDVCVVMASDCSFWGQLRMAELLPDSPLVNRFDASTLPTGSSLTELHTKHRSMKLDLPTTKANQFKAVSACLTAQPNSVSSAPHAVRHHILVNRITGDTPLASYLTPDGSRRCLTKKAFIARCNELAALDGFDPITGHSFRIGGTTHLLLAGVDSKVVQAMGRWSSDAFMQYWREVEALGVLHVEDLRVL